VHLYHLDFLCEKVGGELMLTNETVAYGYFGEDELVGLDMHGSHAVRVPYAFRANRDGEWQTLFQ
jgi:hypothetical protein